MSDEQYTVKFIKLTKSIIISYGSFTISLDKSDPRFQPVLDAIESKDLNSIPKIVQNAKISKIKDLLKVKK
jgi:hypothetical protein